MENINRIHETLTSEEKVSEMQNGANWFFWIAALSAVSSIVAVYDSNLLYSLGFGVNRLVEGATLGYIGQGWPPETIWVGAAVNILIALVVVGFGYYARKGSDMAFMAGMFLYVVDTMVILGFRDYFGFLFHLLALFFLFKGLLGSRKRFDPSV